MTSNKMKADSISNRTDKVSPVQCQELSLETTKLPAFNNGNCLENGKPPHSGNKGSKKHSLEISSFPKGRDCPRQLREDGGREAETLEVQGSPRWCLEVHRQSTHSGESPLLINNLLSASKHATAIDGKAQMRKPTGASSNRGINHVMYYRPNRTHQYLNATDLKDDAAAADEDMLKYGRPTRTTLLRARHRVGYFSTNDFEIRRQLEQRLEELRNGNVFCNVREFLQTHCNLAGEPFHSFVSGARYNRAHYLDSKGFSQYGVYMPRDNPLAFFTADERGEMLDTTSVPSDSPRSDIEENSSPFKLRRRPNTAPGYGKKSHVPLQSRFRHVFKRTSNNGEHRKADNHDSAPVIEEIRVWSPRLNVKGNRLSLSHTREGPTKFESSLPSVQGTSISKLRKFKGPIDDMSVANLPPPYPARTISGPDSDLPVVNPEQETDYYKSALQLASPDMESKPETAQLKPVYVDQSVDADIPSSEFTDQGRPATPQEISDQEAEVLKTEERIEAVEQVKDIEERIKAVEQVKDIEERIEAVECPRDSGLTGADVEQVKDTEERIEAVEQVKDIEERIEAVECPRDSGLTGADVEQVKDTEGREEKAVEQRKETEELREEVEKQTKVSETEVVENGISKQTREIDASTTHEEKEMIEEQSPTTPPNSHTENIIVSPMEDSPVDEVCEIDEKRQLSDKYSTLEDAQRLHQGTPLSQTPDVAVLKEETVSLEEQASNLPSPVMDSTSDDNQMHRSLEEDKLSDTSSIPSKGKKSVTFLDADLSEVKIVVAEAEDMQEDKDYEDREVEVSFNEIEAEFDVAGQETDTNDLELEDKEKLESFKVVVKHIETSSQGDFAVNDKDEES